MLIHPGLAREFEAAAAPLDLKLDDALSIITACGWSVGAQSHPLIVSNPYRIFSNSGWDEERQARAKPEQPESSLAQEARQQRQ